MKDMVAISFSVFKDKILDGTKTQTIRPYTKQRYKALQKCDTLQLYWRQRTKDCELLRVARKESVFLIEFSNLLDWSEELARRDGFGDFAEMLAWFFKKYGAENVMSETWIVTRWYA